MPFPDGLTNYYYKVVHINPALVGSTESSGYTIRGIGYDSQGRKHTTLLSTILKATKEEAIEEAKKLRPGIEIKEE